ncbi:phosphoglucosamine mutase [Candidatus Bathyarchaeota archaeon]|nr:phosphoglucosamine mutase [Candidatus Bathyarchaeota archaeon]
MQLFGTNGVRGVVNLDLTPSLVLELSQSIGTFFKSGKLLVGRDGRLSGHMLSEAVIAGLTSVGCEVCDIGMAPTPCIQYLTQHWRMNGGVAITASHNPPEYNGVKVFARDGVEVSRSDETLIEQIHQRKEWSVADWKHVGRVYSRSDGIDRYVRDVARHFDRETICKGNLTVLVDPGNGVGALTTPYVLRDLGCGVRTINSNVDGTFPSRPSEPTPDNLKHLTETVKDLNIDFAVALDGDGDRAIFFDEKGQVYWGDKTFALIEKFFLMDNPGEKIVTPVSSSQIIEEVARTHGGSVIWTRVGSVDVSRKMIETGAKFGGEENGGIFYAPHIPVRDGTIAAAFIANILTKTKEKLSGLIEQLPSYQNAKEKVFCPNEKKEKVLEEIRRKADGTRIETIDGVKIWYDDNSWILIRPSGTEPAFRLFAEAKTKHRTDRLISDYRQITEDLVNQ